MKWNIEIVGKSGTNERGESATSHTSTGFFSQITGLGNEPNRTFGK